MKNLFLISSSYYDNKNYLDHCENDLKAFLGSISSDEIILFVPFAFSDLDKYTSMVKKYFAGLGYNIKSLHEYSRRNFLLDKNRIKAIFVGGGNTFLLKSQLEKIQILDMISNQVQTGLWKYVGSSAGAIIACPTIMTTNDMPIVMPGSFNALGLVNFQINPHFIEGKMIPSHMGETRETRIGEYHEHNILPVIGLPESSWIVVKNKESTLYGDNNAVIFLKNGKKYNWMPGNMLSKFNIY